MVSIVGAFRQRKSFFLEYCLRFMYGNVSQSSLMICKYKIIFIQQYKSVNFMDNPLSIDWMGPPDLPLTGFSWQKSSKRETSGIIMWSDVFLHTTNAGDDVAIILADTQGLFYDLVSLKSKQG